MFKLVALAFIINGVVLILKAVKSSEKNGLRLVCICGIVFILLGLALFYNSLNGNMYSPLY